MNGARKSYLQQNPQLCWLLQATIVVASLFCGTGLWPCIVRGWQHTHTAEYRAERASEKAYYRSGQAVEDYKHLQEFARKKYEKASELGKDYGPWLYFVDLFEIHVEGYKLPHFQYPSVEVGRLCGLHQGSTNFNQDMVEARDWFKAKSVEMGWEEPERDKDVMTHEMLRWLLKYYLHSLLFCILLYLVRMAGDHGIRATFRESPVDFLLAVLFWPLCVKEYPHKVITEVRVEVEMRRSGGLWQRLDRARIREIASSPHCGQFIASMRRINEHSLAPSFAVALMATLLCLILYPLLPRRAHASTGHSRAAQMMCYGRDGPILDVDIGGLSDTDDDSPPTCWAVLPDILDIPAPDRILGIISLRRSQVPRQEGDKMDHVPLYPTVSLAT